MRPRWWCTTPDLVRLVGLRPMSSKSTACSCFGLCRLTRVPACPQAISCACRASEANWSRMSVSRWMSTCAPAASMRCNTRDVGNSMACSSENCRRSSMRDASASARARTMAACMTAPCSRACSSGCSDSPKSSCPCVGLLLLFEVQIQEMAGGLFQRLGMEVRVHQIAGQLGVEQRGVHGDSGRREHVQVLLEPVQDHGGMMPFDQVTYRLRNPGGHRRLDDRGLAAAKHDQRGQRHIARLGPSLRMQHPRTADIVADAAVLVAGIVPVRRRFGHRQIPPAPFKQLFGVVDQSDPRACPVRRMPFRQTTGHPRSAAGAPRR